MVSFACIYTLGAKPPLLVGIAGGTASGKTTFGKKLQEKLHGHSLLMHMDDYYYDLSQVSPKELEQINFDHPDACNTALFYQHLLELKKGNPVTLLSFDFLSRISSFATAVQQPAEIILVEGMQLFTFPEIRDLFDIKIFIDIDLDVRLLRRIDRDIQERGFSFEESTQRYLITTKAMHDLFVEPTKKYADIIIPKGGQNQIALELVAARLHDYLSPD